MGGGQLSRGRHCAVWRDNKVLFGSFCFASHCWDFPTAESENEGGQYAWHNRKQLQISKIKALLEETQTGKQKVLTRKCRESIEYKAGMTSCELCGPFGKPLFMIDSIRKKQLLLWSAATSCVYGNWKATVSRDPAGSDTFTNTMQIKHKNLWMSIKCCIQGPRDISKCQSWGVKNPWSQVPDVNELQLQLCVGPTCHTGEPPLKTTSFNIKL